MEVNISRISIDQQTITPTLTISLNIEFASYQKTPVFISGKLCTNDGKTVSLLNEYQVRDIEFDIRVLSKAQRDDLYNRNIKSNYYAEMTAELSNKAIEHIEELREKDNLKSARFLIYLAIKCITPINSEKVNSGDFLKLNTISKQSNFEIKQSDWVKSYSPQLGIGKFMLLELKIPDNKKVSVFWKDLYEKLSQNVKEMETSIQLGDWQKTMFFARKFSENAKIGDNKQGHKKFREEFDKLMVKDQHGKEGIEELYTAIWKFFEFLSKYSHDKDRLGNIIAMPVSTKEDAYFAYSLSLGLLNLIGNKIDADRPF